MSKILISKSLRDLAIIVEAGLFSNMINKIKTTFSKIPQAQEVMKMLSGLDPKKAFEKLKKALGGKVDKETFEAALKMVKNPKADLANKEAVDLKRIIMTAVLLMVMSNLTGKAMAQDYTTFNNDLSSELVSDSAFQEAVKNDPDNPAYSMGEQVDPGTDKDLVKRMNDPDVKGFIKLINPEGGYGSVPPTDRQIEDYKDAKNKGLLSSKDRSENVKNYINFLDEKYPNERSHFFKS